MMRDVVEIWPEGDLRSSCNYEYVYVGQMKKPVTTLPVRYFRFGEVRVEE